MLSIDEAIAHARDVTNEQKRRSGICIQNDSECDKFSDCIKCSEEHKQLAEWLEELKFIRQWKSDVMDEFCKYDCNSVEEAWHYGYNKAIDDFVNACEKQFTTMYGQRYVDMRDIVNITEQLKEGEKNE